MKVELIAHTPEIETIIAIAGKNCYSKKDIMDVVEKGLTQEEVDKFINMLVGIGHESPIEHGSFTFAIQDVSRSLLAQITRHRIASFSVRSQRYVPMHEARCVTPIEIENCKEANEVYQNAMEQSWITYGTIYRILYDKYITQGMTHSKAEKKAIENARYALPESATTQMVVTMNTRSLLNFFSHRCCNRAQDEIRELSNEMLRLCKTVSPILFKNAGAPCVKGKCTEGKMSCGKPIKGSK